MSEKTKDHWQNDFSDSQRQALLNIKAVKNRLYLPFINQGSSGFVYILLLLILFCHSINDVTIVERGKSSH